MSGGWRIGLVRLSVAAQNIRVVQNHLGLLFRHLLRRSKWLAFMYNIFFLTVLPFQLCPLICIYRHTQVPLSDGTIGAGMEEEIEAFADSEVLRAILDQGVDPQVLYCD